MNQILIIKTSSMGDVIHNLPVIADIHAHFPQAKIDWVVEESFADIPKLHPNVNRVIPVAMRRWRKQAFSQKTWAEISTCKKLLSESSYDAVIDTQGLIKSSLISSWANGPKSGMDKHSAREALASYFYDHKYAIDRNQHAVTRNRALVAQALGYKKPTDAPDYGLAIKNKLTATNRYVMGFHGTSRESKLWPVSYWIRLGLYLAEQQFSLLLPWASPEEEVRANTIAQAVGNAKILPKSTLSSLASIIQQAQAAVGVDTGLSHLSIALNVPTIAIYTDTNPALTGLLASKYATAINLGGVEKIPSVDEVTQALMPLLSIHPH